MSELKALSPLDGRYAEKMVALRDLFSEFDLIRFRILIEVRWLQVLAREQSIVEVPNFSVSTHEALNELHGDFSEADARQVKTIESRTNHDVKAIEYFIKDALGGNQEIAQAIEFIHFALTSEDVNNLVHALQLKGAREKVMLPVLDKIIEKLRMMAHDLADVPMLAHTHGQPASPTTMGKELANVAYRLKRARKRIAEVSILGKINGAVGNFNAHVAAYPEVDWEGLAQNFVESLGLEWNPYTIQIEPHDSFAEFFDAFARANTILIDFDRDM